MHISVLQKEVLQYLKPKPNENFIDCTINGGGHSIVILEKIKPNGRLLGIEVDEELYQKLKLRAKERLVLVNDNFANLKRIAEKEKFKNVQGVLFDLGMSSWHLEKSGRGFSFLRNEPLDMRYGKNSEFSAEEIINSLPQEEIGKILKECGGEKFAERIARGIVEARKIKRIKTTLQLVEIIKKTIPSFYRCQKIHFATRTFQAIRIAVNRELDNLKKALPQAVEILSPGGRLAVISFHSLEDKIVKNFIREKARENILKIITKKPVVPGQEEKIINPRSRSGKLRAVIKI